MVLTAAQYKSKTPLRMTNIAPLTLQYGPVCFAHAAVSAYINTDARMFDPSRYKLPTEGSGFDEMLYVAAAGNVRSHINAGNSLCRVMC